MAWIGLIVIPGMALCHTLRPAAGAARNGALAPLVGVGITMAVAELYDTVGVGIRPLTILPAEVGIPLLALSLSLALRRGAPHLRPDVVPASHASAARYVLL